MRWRELEAEFDAGLAQARELADAGAAHGDDSDDAVTTLGDVDASGEVLSLARLAPRALIVESWRRLDQRAHELAMSTLPASEDAGHTGVKLENLVSIGVLPALDYDQYTILRQLRNQAVHEAQFTIGSQEAVEYAILASQLGERFVRHVSQDHDRDYRETPA